MLLNMKEYLIPLSIIIGAIIVSISIYIAVTEHDRKAYEICMENISAHQDKKKDKCLNYTYEK